MSRWFSAMTTRKKRSASGSRSTTTRPNRLIGYYKKWESSGEAGAAKYIKIEGVGKVDEIRDQIFSSLDELK